MRRHVLTIVVAVLLGAVVNVGVAWACAAHFELTADSGDSVVDTGFAGLPSFDGQRWHSRAAERVTLNYVPFRGQSTPSDVSVEEWAPAWCLPILEESVRRSLQEAVALAIAGS